LRSAVHFQRRQLTGDALKTTFRLVRFSVNVPAALAAPLVQPLSSAGQKTKSRFMFRSRAMACAAHVVVTLFVVTVGRG